MSLGLFAGAYRTPDYPCLRRHYCMIGFSQSCATCLHTDQSPASPTGTSLLPKCLCPRLYLICDTLLTLGIPPLQAGLFSFPALAPEPLLALSLGILLSWSPGVSLTLSSLTGLCMGPRASGNFLTRLLSPFRRAVENARKWGP